MIKKRNKTFLINLLNASKEVIILEEITDNFTIHFYKKPAEADVVVLHTQNSTRLSNKEIEKLLKIHKECNQDGWKTIFKLIDYGYTVSDPESYAYAKRCKAFIDKHKLPAIASWKVALAMVHALTPCWINENQSKIKCIFPLSPSKRINFQVEFLAATLPLMKKCGWQKPYLLL